MPRKSPELNLDFNIYVDPSCLSEPMADETPATETPPPPEEVVDEPAVVPETAAEPTTEDTTKYAEEAAQRIAAEEAQQPPLPEANVTPQADAVSEEQPAGEVTVEEESKGKAQQDAEAVDPPVEANESPAAEDAVPEPTPEGAEDPEPEAVPEPDAVEDPVTEPEQTDAPLADDAAAEVETKITAEPELADQAVDAVPEPEQEHPAQPEETPRAEQQAAPDSELSTETSPAEPEPSREVTKEAQCEEGQGSAEAASTPEPQGAASSADDEERGRRAFVDRKTSLRTEALIQAAARAVVAKIEKRKSGEAIDQEADEFDNSLLSTGSQDTYTLGDDTQSAHIPRQSSSRRESSDTHIRHNPSRSISSDDSSSHHEPDDDVFSDRSARSSLCSLDPHDDDDVNIKTPQAKEHLSRRESYASTTTHTMSPRAVSGFSTISGLSQYEDKHFVPTSRETRMPFRTPSEIRAMQMASPTPSVFNGSSPRSAKRLQQSRGIGSPSVSAQYSPKNRSTPPRFKPRKEEPAPLVLLHVTLLPLRWVWGEVLNGMDALVQGSKSLGALEETAAESGLLPFEPSEQLKTLRDAWRELQDRVGDTVLERGILLPHPQNDYEVLEERLLEALELPLRRRARILECGHYLGPANFHALDEESEEDEEDALRDGKKEEKRHWCNTCRHEIRYEDLGPGKVFRVKVYASNGLMRAGAWEACWKEMERVDVEVEPIVDLAVQNELERLGALQLELEELQRRQEMELERMPEPEGEVKRVVSPEQELCAASRQQTETDMEAQRGLTCSRPPSSMQLAQSSTSLVRAATPNPYPAPSQTAAVPIDTSEERRRRDEERLREIYGDAVPVLAQLPAPPSQQPAVDHQHPQNQLYHQSHALTTATQPQMPLLTDGSAQSPHHRHHTQPQHQPHDPYSTHSAPADDGYDRDHRHERPREHRDTRSRTTRPIVLDENSGFVELLMEAFKVLLRDPKNVAIIVLCVFVVVMIKRPGAAVETGLQPVSVGGSVPPSAVVRAPEVYQFEGRREEVPVPVQLQLQVQGGIAEGEGNVVSASTVAFEVSSSASSAADAAGAAATASPEAEVVDVVEEAGPAEERQTTEVEVETDDDEGFQPEVLVEEGNGDGVVTDVCALRGLEYPVTMAGEGPVLDEDETEGAMASQAVENESALATDITEEEEQAVLKEIETDAAETTPAVEGCTAAEPSAEDSAAFADDRCEADLDLDVDIDELLPTPSSPTASTTSLFVPGPLVTERKTVRVFETVTETVRVSVVTQTETVSTVVTAVPQTVEETVYETETVRITVSVPVEEQMKEKGLKGKAKGCKKGWF